MWDIFIVLVIVVAIARTTNLLYGALAAITLIIIYQRTGAPIFIWLNLIAATALVSFVSGAFKNYLIKYTYVSFFFLAITLLPFAVREARAIINPQLENENVFDFNFSIASSDSNKKFAPPMVMSAPAPEAEAVEEVIVSGMRESVKSSGYMKRELIKKDYLPNQQTQTGLAQPNWSENSVYLYWNGPVKADETTKLFLVPPFINRIGYLLSVILPLLLAGVFITSVFYRYE